MTTTRDPDDSIRRRFEEDAARVLRAETLAMAHLAAGMAYELEAPLSRLLVRLRSLAEEGALELDEAIAAAEHVEATVRGLRAFTSTDDEAMGVDVHEAIELAVRLASPDLAARAKLRRNYGPVRRVRGSLGRLTHVLLHVIHNAARSIPAGAPHANTVTVHTGMASGCVVAIDVVDTGHGIEPEDIEYVFDPFFTSKPSPESPGLGLAAARAAAIAMGGDVTVESIVGRGSIFRVTLAALETSDRALLASVTRDTPPARRVLCVAETASGAAALGAVVRDDDARVVFATSDDAVVRLATGEAFDLVICEASADEDSRFRERVGRVAPWALACTFTFASRATPSGTFARVGTEG
jgi:hypothetical protein